MPPGEIKLPFVEKGHVRRFCTIKSITTVVAEDEGSGRFLLPHQNFNPSRPHCLRGDLDHCHSMLLPTYSWIDFYVTTTVL